MPRSLAVRRWSAATERRAISVPREAACLGRWPITRNDTVRHSWDVQRYLYYMAEFELEREVRDALGSRIYAGTSEIQSNIVARLLGLG